MSRRLLVVSPSPGFGGAEAYMLTVAGAASAFGWEVTLSVDDRPETRELVSAARAVRGTTFVPSSISDETRRAAVVRQGIATARLIGRVRPHATLLVLQWPTSGLGCMTGAACLNAPTAVVFQLAPWVVKPRRWQTAARWARSRHQRWIAVSNQNREALAKTFDLPESQIQTIYNGVDSGAPDAPELDTARSALRSELQLPAAATVITTVGRLDVQKGYLDLLEAIPSVLSAHPYTYFVWIGEGELRQELEKRIRREGLQQHVLLLGHRGDTKTLLRGSDLFLLPSRFEGHPFALMEAMASGTPAVSSDAGGSAEILRDRVDGVIHKRGDAADLAEKLTWALGHPRELEGMARSAVARASEFSEERMLRELFSVLEEVSAG